MSGKTIKQFSLLTKLNNDDGVLVQRGNSYYYVNAKSLTTGAEITDTYANIATLASSDNLERGATYYISDKYLWLFAIDSDKFDLSGVFFARNADYQSNGVYAGITTANGFTVNATGTNLGVWTSALTPASGDVSIWDGLHYLNITGANGATDPSVDAVNWELVANTDIDVANTYGYIYEFDGVEYDFNNDTINRRVDTRGNDVSENISLFQWGNDNVASNTVVSGGLFSCLNQMGSLTSNYVVGNVQMVETTSTTSLTNNSFLTVSIAKGRILIYDTTGYTFRNSTITGGGRNIRSIYLIGTIDGESISQTESTIEYDVELTATAYSGVTAYVFGDFVTSGTVTYMCIDATTGNAPPNATYWVEVFDVTTAGRHKLTISEYFNCAGIINLISTSATETIDEIVYDTFPNTQRINFTCETGLATTFDNTAVASLANEGEILASGNIVVDGDQHEFATFEDIDIGGTDYMRIINEQTSIA